MAVRRALAMRARRWNVNSWPILPGSERQPVGWPGWPDGKQFAFVLTHDVESTAGLQKVRQLMELETQLGFRSAFYFIPEGEYRVPLQLRDQLVQNGFEVGVHDLYHDGKLFNSREQFKKHAAKINTYLHDWGAVGFRAGFMLNQLDWLYELDIQYDASAFDTDPFEPQPEGVGTIFPFWVANYACTDGPAVHRDSKPTAHFSGARCDDAEAAFCTSACPGYVELPYTLPQDVTLFVLFREQTIDIWRRKLDWIAQHGGMVLVDVHPDYLCFPGEQRHRATFPVAFYSELLRYVAEHYAGRYWHVLPRQVAGFVRGIPGHESFRKRKRIAMVTYSIYNQDNRVIRYAKALSDNGEDVEVIGLRPAPEQPRIVKVDGVRVLQLHDRFSKRETGLMQILSNTLVFLFKAAWYLAHEHSRRPYDLIHVHNVPDFLVLAALYPRIRGARVILDIHDVLPEFFYTRFGCTERSVWAKLLLWIERLSARCVDHIIVSNDLWKPRYEARTKSVGRCSVFINHVSLEIFGADLRISRNGNDGPILIFHGGLQAHQGLDVAIRAMPRIRERFPSAEFHIYGDGPMRQPWQALAQSLGLGDVVKFYPPVPVNQIACKVAAADVGIVPKRADSFGNEAYSTKIMEFMALGVPVVVSDTRIDRYYFDDSLVRFFTSGDPEALATAVLDVLGNQPSTRKRVENALKYVEANSWEARKGDYVELVDRLCSRGVGTRGNCGAVEELRSLFTTNQRIG